MATVLLIMMMTFDALENASSQKCLCITESNGLLLLYYDNYQTDKNCGVLISSMHESTP